MSQQILPTTMNPVIQVGQILGDLSVKGWGEPKVAVDADPEDLQVEVQENRVLLSCRGDCTLHIPQAAALHIESAHGDASIKYLDHPISIQTVYGSLSLRSLGGAGLGTIHGDLSAKGLQGDLHAQQVKGEAYIRSVQGDCTLEQVLGNLDLRSVDGELTARASGNARIRLSQLSGARYEIQAEGNIHCHIPENASLTLKLSSQAQIIRIKLPQETKTVREAQTEIVLGGGEAMMDLRAGGVLYLFSQSVEWGEGEFGFDPALTDDFSHQIAQRVQSQIETQMEAISRQVSEQITHLTERVNKAGLPPEQVERLIDQARQVSEREMERSQDKLRRAQEKLERKLEAAQRRQEYKARSRGGRSWSFEFTPASRPVTPAGETVTDEERLMILRMLEQKKIIPEEAERLLSALEGK